MFRIRSAHRDPPRRPTQRSHERSGSGRFRTGQDFSVRAYQQFNAARARASGPLLNAVRALGRIVGRFMRHLLEAMHESRRKQAMAVLGYYGGLMNAQDQTRAPVSQMPARAGDGTSFWTGVTAAPAVYGMRIRCSITGEPCEGDRAHLCDEWGCARKGGISPVSHEKV